MPNQPPPPPSLLSRITGLFHPPPSSSSAPSRPPSSSQYEYPQHQQPQQYQYPSQAPVEAGPTLSHEDYFRLRAQQAERDRASSYGDPYDSNSRRAPPPPSGGGGGGDRREYGSVGDGRDRARFATGSIGGGQPPPRSAAYNDDYHSNRRPQASAAPPPPRGRSRSPPRPNFDGPPLQTARQRSPPPAPPRSSNYDSRSQPPLPPLRARSPPPPRQVSSSSYARRSRSPGPSSRLPPPPSSSSLAPGSASRREYSPPRDHRSRNSYDAGPPPSSGFYSSSRGGAGPGGRERDYVDSRGPPPPPPSSRPYPQDDPYSSSSSSYSRPGPPSSRSNYPAPPPPPPQGRDDYRGAPPVSSSRDYDYDPRYDSRDDRGRSGGDRDPYARSSGDSYSRPSWQEPAPPLPPPPSRRGEEYPPPLRDSRDAYRRDDLPSAGRDDRYDSRSYPSQPPPPPPPAPRGYDRAPSPPPRRDYDRRDPPPSSSSSRPIAPQPNFDLPPSRNGHPPPPPSASASASVAPPLPRSREREEASRDRRRPPSEDRSRAPSVAVRDDRDRRDREREPSRREEARMKVDPRRSASRDRGRPEVDRTVSSRESMGSSSQSSRIATPAIDRPPVRESSASSSRDYLPPPPLPSGLRPAVPVPSRRDSTSSQSSFTRPSSTGSNSFPSSSSSSNLQSSSSMSGVGSKRGAARDDLPMLAVKRPRIDYQPPLLNSKGKKIKAPAVLPPAEALKAKPHRRDSEVCPPITREQAPNILLNYVVSLHRPHVRKRHPAAHFEYVAVVEREEGTPVTPEDILKCKITLPAESPVPEKMKSATGEGTRVEGKQEAALKLAVVLWKCGEIDDEFNPVVDAEELARQTKASACLGITPYLAKVPDLWANCIKTKEPRLYPTLITFPAVPVKPPSVVVVPAPPTDQDSEESPLTLMAVEGETPPATATATAPAPTPASDVVEDASTASSPPPTEYKTPRPLLMFTRLPLPVINPGINLYFHEELSTVTFTNFDPLPLPNDEIEAIKAYSLTLIRAVVNRPMIYVDNPDGSSGEGPWYIAPVNLEWYETYRLQQEQKEEKDRQEEMKKGVKPKPDREMLDWKEMSACANETFVTWEFDDAELLEKQSVDAMATGKSEFSRRNEVLRVRRDLNPHSHPDDSPREAGSASLLEFVKTTTTQFQGLSNDSQPLLEIRKISGVLGHVRKLDKPMDATVNKLHDQKYMIPELSQRSTIAASTFLSGLYIPSITNRLEQVLLAKELNQTLFRNSLEEKRLTQALTAPSTGGETDYERLEYIGDSALKYIATTYLYVTRPGDNEHVLHDARKIIIANGSLTQNCVDSGLPHYIHARDFSVKTWYPHNLSVCRPAIMPTDRELKYQEIGDKTKADVVEAVIGAAFDAGGIESAFKTCKTLTVRVPYVDSWTQMANRLKKPASITGFSAQLRGSLPRIQEIIKYKFNNEALLCQALTVTGPNHIHFQRLEFFGDSIVDLLSVKYATSKFPSLGPGPLTHMKSAMINNHTAASFCVHLGLNEFAVFDNTLVQRAITEYVPRIKRAKEKEEELAKSEGRDPGQYWAEIDPPKLLGDVVEAVYAAILIDSGLQWKAVEDFHNNVQRLWMDKYIRGLGSLAGHPSKMLTEILQARRCMNFEIVKTLTSSLRAPALAKTEVMVHGNCLGWAIEQTPTFSSRRASEFALNAIEAEPGLLDKLCDCVWNVGAKGPKNKE